MGDPESGSLLHDGATWRRFRAEMARRRDSGALLASEADGWLTGDVITIVRKKILGPTGDPHDYVSLAPYSWPDPKKPDGLPWITRDGEVNPAFYDYDNPMLERLCHAVPRLVLQAEAVGSAPPARRAGRLLRAWFLDAETRMNPHLRYAQKIPGRAEGTATGIIDATSLIFLADAASRLAFNAEWTAPHLAGVKGWFARYVDWLLTSEPGQKEHAFDFTSAAVLLNFVWQRTGDSALARVCDSIAEHPWQRLIFSKASLTGRDVPRPN